MNIEVVEWVDSTGISRWDKRSSVVATKPLRPTSVGYVVHETDEALYLAQSFDRNDTETQQFDHVMIIPTVSVISRRVILP